MERTGEAGNVAVGINTNVRQTKTSSLKGSFVYHGVAIALLKLIIITCWQHWYRTCRFEHIARFETHFALAYTALAALSVLPPKLPVS